MAFDIADRRRVDVCVFVGHRDGLSLALNRRRRECDFVCAVVVDTDAFDHAQNAILVADGLR